MTEQEKYDWIKSRKKRYEEDAADFISKITEEQVKAIATEMFSMVLLLSDISATNSDKAFGVISGALKEQLVKALAEKGLDIDLSYVKDSEGND